MDQEQENLDYQRFLEIEQNLISKENYIIAKGIFKAQQLLEVVKDPSLISTIIMRIAKLFEDTNSVLRYKIWELFQKIRA